MFVHTRERPCVNNAERTIILLSVCLSIVFISWNFFAEIYPVIKYTNLGENHSTKMRKFVKWIFPAEQFEDVKAWKY